MSHHNITKGFFFLSSQTFFEINYFHPVINWLLFKLSVYNDLFDFQIYEWDWDESYSKLFY